MKTIYIILIVVIIILSIYYIFTIRKTHLNQYLSSIHPNMYKIKVPNYTGNNFKQSYKKNLVKVPNKYKNILNHYTNKIDNILSNNNLHNLTKIPWKLIMSINNLEMGMPFTLDNKIVINEKSLETINNTPFNKSFMNTLLHEKLHIFQRYNQNKFNRFYIQNYPFLHRKLFIQSIPNTLRRKYMTNPDSNFDYWTYKIDGEEYYPILEKINNQVKSIAYSKNEKNTIMLDNIKTIWGLRKNTSCYHPNEIFACEISHKLLNGNLDKQTKHFLHNL